MSELEQLLLLEIEAAGLPIPARESRFHKTRKWRADFLWENEKVIAECNGGTYRHMGHSTGVGLSKDYEKQNSAQLMGYIYLEFDKQMVEDGTAIKTIAEAIRRQG